MISIFIKVTKLLKIFNLAEVINHDVRFSASRTFYPLNDKVLNTTFFSLLLLLNMHLSVKVILKKLIGVLCIYLDLYGYAKVNNRNVHLGEVGFIINDGTQNWVLKHRQKESAQRIERIN